MRELRLKLSDTTAENISNEANALGIDPIDLIRRGIAEYIINRTALRDIEAHFPAESKVTFNFIINAAAGGHVKVFEVDHLELLTGTSIVHLIDEYTEEVE